MTKVVARRGIPDRLPPPDKRKSAEVDASPVDSFAILLRFDAPKEEAPADSFVDGVLTTKEVEIAITDYRVIPVGEIGNEYGDVPVPVLAIWYDTTNLGTSDREISPLEFIYTFEAFQDNDPDRENTLNLGSLPDDTFSDTQTENIKAGGTLSNAVAYELDDTTTPVELVAGGMIGDEIGRMSFNLS